MFEIKSEKFNGPLDLLLQLIEKQKLEITEIALAEVTDGYIKEIEKLEDKDPEELSDFLVLAARLLFLKSKALLPILDEEEDLDDLAKQLKMYKEFVEASKKIQALISEGKFSFSRKKMIEKTEVEFSPPSKLKVSNLKSTFLIVLRRLDPLVKMPRQMVEKTVSLQQTIFDMQKFIKERKKFGFSQVLNSAKNKTEVIINFLALLELLKRHQLTLKQSKNFDDIIIEKI